jgi:type I restriction enzyme, S subunit
MSNWEIIPIGQLCHAIYDGPHATPKKVESGPIFLGISNLSNGRIDLSITEHLSESDFVRWTKRVTPKEDDIVFSYETRLGEAALVPRGIKCCLGRRMALMRPDLSKVDPQFLLYAYLSPNFQGTIQSRTIYGSTVNRIALTEFPSYPIKIPPLSIQKEISSLLGNLDRKIENLRKQNETLERIAQTLFKYWFVDFEFPNDDGKPYKSSGGEMVRSELGEIPVGWRFEKMEDIIEVRDGTHESPKQKEQGFYLITSKHLKKEGIDFESAYLISESDYMEVNKRSKVDSYDILLSMIGTVGLLYFVLDQDINFAIKNIGLFKASRNLDYAEYIFLFLSSDYGKTYFRTRLAGTTQSYLTLSSLREMPLIIPDKITLLGFKKMAKSLFRKSHANNQQIQTLTKTRDALLPKLMSGQLRLPEGGS